MPCSLLRPTTLRQTVSKNWRQKRFSRPSRTHRTTSKSAPAAHVRARGIVYRAWRHHERGRKSSVSFSLSRGCGQAARGEGDQMAATPPAPPPPPRHATPQRAPTGSPEGGQRHHHHYCHRHSTTPYHEHHHYNSITPLSTSTTTTLQHHTTIITSSTTTTLATITITPLHPNHLPHPPPPLMPPIIHHTIYVLFLK